MCLSIRDKKVVWHPFTQEQTAPLPLAITHAKGSYVYDENGQSYLDLISSWWVNLHGHAHPQIAQSIYEQALKLEQIIFAGFTHQPAVELCEQLISLLPADLSRCFFSDNGSTSVEVALKMAYQYWYNQGNTDRTLFLSFDGGYHGDTFGAMAVGQKSGFFDLFNELCFKVLSVPFPATWDQEQAVEAKEQAALAVLDRYLATEGTKIAAMILEPLIQGASGMRFCRPTFVAEVINRVRQWGILVIFDEIMTGFGRTGSTFALEQIGVPVDLLCLSKGITGGFLPLAVTVTTEKIYNAFLSSEWKHAFVHGHSYTANPLACAAAITSLELLRTAETQANIAAINNAHRAGLEYCMHELPRSIKQCRVRGTIAAFELEHDVGNDLKREALSLGLIIRPLGDTVYLLPPYSTTSAELSHVYKMIAKIITKCQNSSK